MRRSRSFKSVLRDLTPRFLDVVWIRLENSPLGGRLVRGSFWSLLGSFASRALGLVAAVFAARILGKAVYGELGIIQSTVGMLGIFAGFGMGTTATKYVAELRDKDPVRAGGIIAISSLVSWGVSLALLVGLFFAAPWLCVHTLAAPQLTGYLRLSGLLLVWSGINGAQLGVLSGFEAFKSIARVSAFTGLVSFPLIVGGAFLFGLSGILWGMILAQAFGCLLNMVAMRQEAKQYGVPISFSLRLSEIRVVWKFSLPAVLGSAMISVVTWAASTMLVRQLNGYSEMGVFSAANQWFGALMWLPYMVSGVTLPMLAERLGAGDKANVVKLLKMTFAINAAIILPVAAIGCLLSRYIMMSYGKGFTNGWPTLIAVLITAAILSFVVIVGELVAASGHMWLGFFLNVGWGAIFLGAAVLLLKWGSFGLASARLLAYGIYTIFMGAYLAFFILRRKVNGDGVKSSEPAAVGLSEIDISA
jgi:O-antigen/teichoic acid export membrane protein